MIKRMNYFLWQKNDIYNFDQLLTLKPQLFDILENGSKYLLLHANDIRYKHLVQVLQKEIGDTVKGAFEGFNIQLYTYSYMDKEIALFKITTDLEESTISRSPVRLYLGLTRPPTSERLIRDLCAIGIDELVLIQSTLCEKSYAQSKIWHEKNLNANLQLGMQQGGITTAMKIRHLSWHSFIYELKEQKKQSALQYLLSCEKKGKSPAVQTLSETLAKKSSTLSKCFPLSLIIGPERGFTQEEDSTLRELAQAITLGNSILRSENVAITMATLSTSLLS